MDWRAKWVAGFAGGMMSLSCALAQTAAPPVAAPSPAASSATVAAPTPSAPVAPKVAAPAPNALPTPASTPAAAAAPTPAAPSAPAVTPASAPAPNAAPGEPIPVDAAPKPKRKPKPAPPPLETALSTDPHPSFSPDTFFFTQKAAERYAGIVEAGGWPTDIVPVHPGSKGPAVAKLRRRLQIEGDLDENAPVDGRGWDKALTEAVKRFQQRVGLRPTGGVSGATLKAINVPAETRRQQLVASAQRIANVNFEFGDRYVVVNLPSTSVEAVEGKEVVHRYVAIVGDPEHASPEISAHISVINLNPTWTVPVSIIKKEIIPRMQRDPGYLTRSKIRILDGQGHEIEPRSIDWTTSRAANFTLRQDSGAGNSLGSIRIGMPNKLAVYMHDTPGKALFGRDFRFLSHGCVRVQGVYDYAAWLLEGTPAPTGGAWEKADLLAKVKETERLDIKLTKAVPVIWVYLTGWSNQEGVADFRDDVYGMDPGSEASANAVANAEATQPAAAAAPAAPAPTPPAPSFSPLSPFAPFFSRH